MDGVKIQRGCSTTTRHCTCHPTTVRELLFKRAVHAAFVTEKYRFSLLLADRRASHAFARPALVSTPLLQIAFPSPHPRPFVLRRFSFAQRESSEKSSTIHREDRSIIDDENITQLASIRAKFRINNGTCC